MITNKNDESTAPRSFSSSSSWIKQFRIYTSAPQQAGESRYSRQNSPAFKDQRSANKLREQLSDLSRKINTEVHPVFTSHNIKDELKAKEPKPPIVNQQNVVYFFQCDLCDADYVGYTSRHLHQLPGGT